MKEIVYTCDNPLCRNGENKQPKKEVGSVSRIPGGWFEVGSRYNEINPPRLCDAWVVRYHFDCQACMDDFMEPAIRTKQITEFNIAASARQCKG